MTVDDALRRGVARTLTLDWAAAVTVAALRDEGIRSILLKGASTQRLLYGRTFRPYCDVDLLVAPTDWSAAIACLSRLGFQDMLQPPNLDKHSRPLRRADGVVVDLHRSLVTVPCDPDRCWEVLSARSGVQPCGGGAVEMLTPPALATVIALHAAQHGADEVKPVADLQRAVDGLDDETWREAVAVAAALGATEATAAGLRLVTGGAELAGRLGLPGVLSAPVRLRAASAPTASLELARILTASSRAERRRLLRPILAPTTTELRRRAWAREVADWPAGVVLARVVWWARLAYELPEAARWFWRHRHDRSAVPVAPDAASAAAGPGTGPDPSR